jgi:hypothetical protein
MFSKFLLAALSAGAKAWSMPGVTPKNYEKGKVLDIFVGQLYSDRTSFTFDYYSLNWCMSTKGHAYDRSKVS